MHILLLYCTIIYQIKLYCNKINKHNIIELYTNYIQIIYEYNKLYTKYQSINIVIYNLIILTRNQLNLFTKLVYLFVFLLIDHLDKLIYLIYFNLL